LVALFWKFDLWMKFRSRCVTLRDAICWNVESYEGVFKSFRTGRLERELQMIQLSATRCSCIAILWVSLVSFAAITLCIASQRVCNVVYFVIDQSEKFWIHIRILFLSRS
jgi:hypothetical protein